MGAPREDLEQRVYILHRQEMVGEVISDLPIEQFRTLPNKTEHFLGVRVFRCLNIAISGRKDGCKSLFFVERSGARSVFGGTDNPNVRMGLWRGWKSERAPDVISK